MRIVWCVRTGRILSHISRRVRLSSLQQRRAAGSRCLRGFVYTVPGTLSRKYLSLVATFIDWNLRRGNAEWFLDQVALSVSLDALPAIEQMAIHREPLEKLIDIRYTDDTFSWTRDHAKSGGEAYQNYKAAMQQTYFG